MGIDEEEQSNYCYLYMHIRSPSYPKDKMAKSET